MTSIEWLIEEILSKGFFKESVTLTNIDHLQYKAEEIHKEEIKNAWDNRNKDVIKSDGKTSEQYYQETFVSKGSATKEESKQETLEEAANIDFSLFKKGVFKWQQEQQLPQQEISDKKILDVAYDKYVIEDEIEAFIQGANWIQEQIK
jgi:hypothetical protein